MSDEGTNTTAVQESWNDRPVTHNSLTTPRNSSIRPSSLAVVANAPRHIESVPRRLQLVPGNLDHPLKDGRYQTPLRYPGAKTGLADLIGRLVRSAGTSRQTRQIDMFVEPFAGGASTSLRLAGAGIVDRVLLADADPLVAAFWQIAASETENLIDRMEDEYEQYLTGSDSVSLDRWDYWRGWTPPISLAAGAARFEAAMKCLFLNRTTFSGILHGRAGPIGGRAQKSPYGIACRFNVDSLSERLRYVGHLYSQNRLVDVWCKDWAETLADVPDWYPQLIPNRVLAYLDPPYLGKSSKLYQRSFDAHGGYAPAPVDDLHWSDHAGHCRLAQHLKCKMQFRWILSYDAHPALLREAHLYSTSRMTPSSHDQHHLRVRRWTIAKRRVSLNYTASARSGRGPAEEFLLTTLPESTVPVDELFRLAT